MIPIGNKEAFEKIEKDMENDAKKFLDFNGDGKINGEDGKSAWTKLQPWLARHVPLSGGLFAGFTAGMR